MTASPFTEPEGGVAREVPEIFGAGPRAELAVTAERTLVIDAYGTPAATLRSGRDWRETVKEAAIKLVEARPWAPLAGAVEIQLIFYLQRPASAPRSKTTPIGRSNSVVKLVRPVLDVLVEVGALAHDGLVVDLLARKRFAVERAPGATIVVRGWAV